MEDPKLTIRDIVKVVEWKDVKRSFKYYFPRCRGNYELMFDDLCKCRKRKPKYEDEYIEIDVGNYSDVLTDNVEECYYGIGTNKYSFSFRNWRELANIPIDIKTIRHYRYQEIIAIFIWEITYYGNEEQTKKIFADIQNSAAEIKKEQDNNK